MRERRKPSRRWTKDEDEALRQAIMRYDEGQTIDWHEVASYVPGRSNKDCRKRWVYTLGVSINKGSWDADEDERLRHGVQLHGYRWILVSQVVGTRQSDQCSRRWHECLNPYINRDRWSLIEDYVLEKAVRIYGRNWTEIVERFFPDRTPIAARNRYKQRFDTVVTISPATSSRAASILDEDDPMLWNRSLESQSHQDATLTNATSIPQHDFSFLRMDMQPGISTTGCLTPSSVQSLGGTPLSGGTPLATDFDAAFTHPGNLPASIAPHKNGMGLNTSTSWSTLSSTHPSPTQTSPVLSSPNGVFPHSASYDSFGGYMPETYSPTSTRSLPAYPTSSTLHSFPPAADNAPALATDYHALARLSSAYEGLSNGAIPLDNFLNQVIQQLEVHRAGNIQQRLDAGGTGATNVPRHRSTHSTGSLPMSNLSMFNVGVATEEAVGWNYHEPGTWD